MIALESIRRGLSDIRVCAPSDGFHASQTDPTPSSCPRCHVELTDDPDSDDVDAECRECDFTYRDRAVSDLNMVWRWLWSALHPHQSTVALLVFAGAFFLYHVSILGDGAAAVAVFGSVILGFAPPPAWCSTCGNSGIGSDDAYCEHCGGRLREYRYVTPVYDITATAAHWRVWHWLQDTARCWGSRYRAREPGWMTLTPPVFIRFSFTPPDLRASEPSWRRRAARSFFNIGAIVGAASIPVGIVGAIHVVATGVRFHTMPGGSSSGSTTIDPAHALAVAGVVAVVALAMAVLHEAAHAASMWVDGHRVTKANFSFAGVFPAGASVEWDDEEVEEYSSASRLRSSMAGVFVNLATGSLALLLVPHGPLSVPDPFLSTTGAIWLFGSLSIATALGNAIPIMHTDGSWAIAGVAQYIARYRGHHDPFEAARSAGGVAGILVPIGVVVLGVAVGLGHLPPLGGVLP